MSLIWAAWASKGFSGLWRKEGVRNSRVGAGGSVVVRRLGAVRPDRLTGTRHPKVRGYPSGLREGSARHGQVLRSLAVAATLTRPE